MQSLVFFLSYFFQKLFKKNLWGSGRHPPPPPPLVKEKLKDFVLMVFITAENMSRIHIKQ